MAPPTRGEDAECAARGGARVERYGRDGAYQPRSCVVSCIVSHLALPTASPRRTTRAFAVRRLASRLRLIAAGADARPDFSAPQIEEAFEKEVKVLVVGNGAVGKTSMMKRFCRDNFTDEYKKTIGVDFLEKTRYVDALREDVRLMVWDTAGQEEFDTITRTYYRGCASPRPPHAAPIPVPSRLISRAHSPPRVFSPHPLRSAGAAVLVFSTTDRASFDAIRRWRDKVEEQCGPIAMCICQNKVDLIDDAAVDPGEPEALARELGLKLYRVCVKDDFNVDAVFDYLVDQWSKIPEETGVGPAMDISEIAKGERRGVAGGTWQAAALGRARAGAGGVPPRKPPA